MSRIKFKFIDALSNLVFQNVKVQNGDKIEDAIGKLQGQLDAFQGTPVATAPAISNIPAGKFVGIKDGFIVLADASERIEAVGFLASPAFAGQTANAYSGVNTFFTGLTPGKKYYLGLSGNVTINRPTANRYISQYLGKANSASSLSFSSFPAILKE